MLFRSAPAQAAARDQLAAAIANTRGSYLVYNFGAGFPAPMLNAAGDWYEMTNGGHLMIIKAACGRLAPRLLVDTHQGAQARCESTPGARTREGLPQASETYTPLQALSGGDEVWTALSTLILPVRGVPTIVTPKTPTDYGAAEPVVASLIANGTRFVAVSGIQLLAPGDTGQLNDGGPSAARTAVGYARDRDEMYVFQGGNYTPDQIQDLFRGLGSDTAVLLDGGGSSAVVLRRDTGGMWAGAGSPRGSCDTMAVLCDAHERALPAWLAFN